MEFFREDPTELGCSIIYVADVLSSLSENIQTVISIKDRNQGQLLLQEGFFVSLTSNWITSLKAMIRKPYLAWSCPLKHIQQLKSSIPDSVTFLEMYQAETFNDLKVLSRWESHALTKVWLFRSVCAGRTIWSTSISMKSPWTTV